MFKMFSCIIVLASFLFVGEAQAQRGYNFGYYPDPLVHSRPYYRIYGVQRNFSVERYGYNSPSARAYHFHSQYDRSVRGPVQSQPASRFQSRTGFNSYR